jgi:hypothetical protein
MPLNSWLGALLLVVSASGELSGLGKGTNFSTWQAHMLYLVN